MNMTWLTLCSLPDFDSRWFWGAKARGFINTAELLRALADMHVSSFLPASFPAGYSPSYQVVTLDKITKHLLKN